MVWRFRQHNRRKKAIHSLFIDFSKALVLVDHSILLSKLRKERSISPCGSGYGTFSKTEHNKSNSLVSYQRHGHAQQGGVPQGSVISPLLFSIFKDDFDDSIPVQLHDRVQMCKYADGCTAFESIPIGELSNMQEVLDGLRNWATTNNMLLNPKKTKNMWISFSKNSIKPDALRINDSCLERVSKFKLLGVWQKTCVRTIMLNRR